MAVTTSILGTNTAVIEYTSGETYVNLMTAVHNFMITKNWESLDAAPWAAAADVWIRTYRIHNVDGVSYKYVQFRYNSTNLALHLYVMQNYNSGTMTATNIAYLSDSWAATRYFGVLINLNVGGQIYLSVCNKWVAVDTMTYAGTIGTSTGSSFFGCFETTCANVEDDPTLYPPYVWLCGHLSAIAISTSYTYVASPPNTKTQVGSAAAQYTRLITPLGSWGYLANSGAPITYGTLAHTIIPANTNPFNGQHNAFDLLLSVESNYVKGKIYGLKVISRGVGSLGDVIRIPIDVDGFTAPSGTVTDHLILPEYGSAYTLRFALPL